MSGSVDTRVKIWDCRARSQEPIQQLEDCKVRCATLMSKDLTFLLTVKCESAWIGINFPSWILGGKIEEK